MVSATVREKERQESGGYKDQAEAIASLPADLALLRMENDSIQSLAAARPRDMGMIKAELSDTLEQFPVLAQDAIYNKPVGWVFIVLCKCGSEYEATKLEQDSAQCPRCGKFQPDFDKRQPRRVQKFARNLSIRAAEALAEAYGFNRLRCDVSDLPNDRVKVEATFVDFQRGRIWQDAGIVSPWYRARGGSMQRVPEDRFLNVTLKAEKSKYIREVINRSVNQGLKAWFYDQCEQIQDKLLDDVTVKKIIAQFATKGIDQESIEAKIVGRPLSAGWTNEDRKTLLGVWTALKENETTVAELLADADGPKSTPQNQTPTVSADALLNGAKTVNEEAKPAAQPPADEAPSDVNLILGQIAQAAKIADVNYFELQAKRFAEPEAKRVVEACLKRKEEIRAARGGKTPAEASREPQAEGAGSVA